MSTGEKFERAVAIMERLRAPGGCPWDREQTFDTIKKYTLEETYEVLESIENRDWPELTEELGDLLSQVLFYAEMAKEEAFFTINDVLDALSNKLIGRHPHVFGNVKAENAQQVLKNWEALKKEEKQRKAASNGKKSVERNEPGLLDAVSRKMPSLMEAQKISSKAAHVGFDWPDLEGIFEKLAEETEELREHVHELPREATAATGDAKIPSEIHARLEDELGDLFFVVVNLARRLQVDPESALRRTNRKFRQRFGWLESELRKHGKTPEHATLDEMESLWQQAKTFEEGGR